MIQDDSKENFIFKNTKYNRHGDHYVIVPIGTIFNRAGTRGSTRSSCKNATLGPLSGTTTQNKLFGVKHFINKPVTPWGVTRH